EFEYADRNYLNSNLYFSNETEWGDKWKVRVGFFNNSDARNTPINQSLDPSQKSFLRQLGDSIQQAFYPNALLDTFSADKILYKKIDTTYDGGLARDSIYVYSVDPDNARYRLSFVELGPGRGNYVPDINGANGKVYKWIAPVNGVKQGRFEPVQFLVTPKRQQVLTVGVDYKLSKRFQLVTEGALSRYDRNLFSSRDNRGNEGFAAKMQLKHSIPVGAAEKKLQWNSDAGFEWVQATFKPLERLRNVEFTRDWGLPLAQTPNAEEKILTAGTELSSQGTPQLRYQITRYQRGSSFTGLRNSLQHNQQFRNWTFNNLIMLTRVLSATDKGYFFRPTLQVAKKIPAWRNYSLTASYSLEHNEIRDRKLDTVAPQSFSFSVFQAGLQSDVARPNRWSLTYFTRTDAYPVAKALIKSDRSQNINLSAELLKSERHQFRFNSTYRQLSVFKEGITNLKPDQTLLGRAEYQVNEWKGFLTGNLLYEAGTGQEQKRDITYVEVPAGQGAFTWKDYNNDGIQQLNEFEAAVFQDQANYIRIFTPTNEFVKANYNTLNYTVALNPRAAFQLTALKNWRKFLSNINLQSSFQTNSKQLNRGKAWMDPLAFSVKDSSLITLNSVWVNTFSYNRFSTVWGIDLNQTRSSSKALLTYGYESRTLQDWSLRLRWNINRSVTLDWLARKGVNQLVSSNKDFGSRNYEILQYSGEPRITYTRSSNFRMGMGYKLGWKENREGERERAFSHVLNAEVKYNLLQQTSVQAKLTLNDIRYSSKTGVPKVNSPSAYILLEGLVPGTNFLWTVDLSKRLTKSLELNIQYEGRKPGASRVVHIGRASIRALL
ncbi:MAG: hypothetical protein ACKO6K_02830, partial [Chitinophagaceae bacterium]